LEFGAERDEVLGVLEAGFEFPDTPCIVCASSFKDTNLGAEFL
jgi:hypothetical protein